MNAFEAIPDLKIRDGEPVFSEPWEAQAFALVVGLHEQGYFEWQEWADVLSATLANAPKGNSYYQCWLLALDRMVSEKSLITNTEFNTRAEEWKAALEATPHGEPIELQNGQEKLA